MAIGSVFVAIDPRDGTLGHRPAEILSLAFDIWRGMGAKKNARLWELDDADLARRIFESGASPAEAEEAELCRRYLPRLRLYGLRHLRAEDRADDLAQDVLLIALGKLRAGDVREPDRIGSFILGVARMRTKSSHRTSGRDAQFDESTDALSLKDIETPDPIARDHIVRCLETLNEQQRAVVVLTYYGEQSTRAVASSLGLSANNVRVTRHRSIARLRECLGLDGQGAVA
jgi:RNA polymerase sigma-70 factor (ECF subfamily)